MFQDRSTYYPQDVERSGEPWIVWGYFMISSGYLRMSQDISGCPDRSKHDAAEISGYPRYISGYNNISQARLGHLGLDQNISEYSKVSQDIFRMSQDISGQIRISWEYLRIGQDISGCFKIDQHIIPRMSKDQENPGSSEDISWHPPDISGCLRISQDVADRSKHDAAEISGYLRYISGYNNISQARLGYLGLDQNISEYLKVSQDIFRMSQDISGQIRISWEYLRIDQDISGCFKIDQHIIPRMSKDQENPGSSEDISWYPPDISGCLRISQDVADRSKHDAAEISGYPRYISGYNNISHARLGYLGLDQNVRRYLRISSGCLRICQDRSGYPESISE